MRILLVTEYFTPWVPGGSAWSIALLAAELARQGHEVAVLTPNWGAAPEEAVDGVPVFRFPVGRRLPPGAATAPTRDLVSPVFHLRVMRATLDLGRRLGAQVVHAQEKHVLLGAWAAARRLRVPVFATVRDYGLLCPIATCLLSHTAIPADCGSVKLQRECAPEFFRRYLGGAPGRRLGLRARLALLYWDARLKGRLLRRVDGLVSVSRATLGIYAGAGRAPAGRSHVVHNAPPLPPQGPAPDRARLRERLGLPDRPLVLFVGRLSPGKGIEVLLEAARQMAAGPNPPCLVIAGPGSLPPVPAGVDARLLGPRPQAEVFDLYRVADLVVQPAVAPEPFSRVPLEAAAFGCPVVASDAGGNAEAVVDGVTGLLVPRDNAAALARALGRLLADEPLRAKLGEQARAHVAQAFGAEAAARALLAAYGSALR